MTELSINLKETQLVLIGTSKFQNAGDFSKSDPVVKNIAELKQLFTNDEIIGVPESNITEFINEKLYCSILNQLIEIVEKTRDTIIIYYVGQSSVSDNKNDEELYLALKDTKEKSRLQYNAIPFSKILDILLDEIFSEKLKNVIIILDCLHGKEITDKALSHIGTDKNLFVLVSNCEKSIDFTSTFIEMLENGIGNGRKKSTLGEIYEYFKGKESKIIAESLGEADKLELLFNQCYKSGEHYYDIFISYAQTDNESLSLNEIGVITDLKNKLQNLLLEKKKEIFFGNTKKDDYLVCMSYELKRDNVLESKDIIEQLKNSTILLLFLSPSYLRSNWCMSVYKEYWKNIKDNKRVFVIQIESIEDKAFIQELSEKNEITIFNLEKYDKEDGNKYPLHFYEQEFDHFIKCLSIEIFYRLNLLQQLKQSQ